MGAYLSTPVTDKEIFSGEATSLVYGGGSMQVWGVCVGHPANRAMDSLCLPLSWCVMVETCIDDDF